MHFEKCIRVYKWHAMKNLSFSLKKGQRLCLLSFISNIHVHFCVCLLASHAANWKDSIIQSALTASYQFTIWIHQQTFENLHSWVLRPHTADILLLCLGGLVLKRHIHPTWPGSLNAIGRTANLIVQVWFYHTETWWFLVHICILPHFAQFWHHSLYLLF